MVKPVEEGGERYGCHAIDRREGPPHEPCPAFVAAVHNGMEHRLYDKAEYASRHEDPEQREVVDAKIATIGFDLLFDLLAELPENAGR